MLLIKKIILQIENNIETIIKEDTGLGRDLWHILLQQHPADIAMLIAQLDFDDQVRLFKKLPQDVRSKVFEKIPENIQAVLLVNLDQQDATTILKGMPVDNITDLFDYLSDEDLEKYLKLLHSKQRNQIISLLNFEPSSAGGRMQSNVITFQDGFTVQKSINLLQRLSSTQEIMHRVYVTNAENIVVGYVTLEQLVLNKPESVIARIMGKNELLVYVDEDQEDIVEQMEHYDLVCAPVVDKEHHFLGVITADDVYDIIKEEGSEDVYKMSGLSPMEHSYFATPWWVLIRQRLPWLVGLLILQSFSSIIMASYGTAMGQYVVLTFFLTMLVGTGGNAGNQSATLVIRGLTTKEITRQNGMRMLLREFGISLGMAFLLAIVGFLRVWMSAHNMLFSFIVGTSLFVIVVTSVLLGAFIPMLLERLGVDPAHSATPFLTTLMDILGVLIYCSICSSFLT
ncbi:MAG: Response regulator receiver protein [candidate division TM6 bacterium GW2011_GWF2_38_10]|nr:MAG: Response regulator receiver protein [candidate division TM6 bacterium GW2011_GWF2_38_10]